MPTVLLTAVEPSADALGAGLMRALKTRNPAIRFVGVGGPLMAAAGLNSLFDSGELTVIGFVEGALAYGKAKRRAEDVAQLAVRERADVAVLIDSWGFSYLTAKALRAASPATPLIKYVAPQVWATRAGRAKALADLFDHLISILPVDRPYFEHLPVAYTQAAHPMLAQGEAPGDGEALRARLGIGADDPLLLVLPGSRRSEIRRLMPPFEATAARLKAAFPGLAVAFVVAPSVAEMVHARLGQLAYPHHVIEGEAQKRDAMAAATAALACSGTVTTELAMAGCPMVVAYKVSPLTAVIARAIVKARFVTLFNLAAGRAVAPEFLQEACTAEALAEALAPLLNNPERRDAQVRDQNEALELMGRGAADPADVAAKVVLSYLPATEG